jgi:hypothetical protein
MMGIDMQASRGLIALLVATVAFFALWIVALKPGGSSKSPTASPAHGLSGYQADIAAAHQAVQTSNADNARSGADPSSTAASSASGGTQSALTTHTAPATATHAANTQTHVALAGSARGSGTPAGRLRTVRRAMRAHDVVAMLFYNPVATDDQAVKQELAVVPTHRGRVVKLAIPLREIAGYTDVTEQVPVNLSPTLVLVAPNGQADEIVGFSDRFEIAQRVDQALATR